jgi:thioredoxin reductase
VQYGQVIDPLKLKIFTNLKLDKINKIIVDDMQQTNLDKIYAVGNCCNYSNRPGTISMGCGEAALAINVIVNQKKTI